MLTERDDPLAEALAWAEQHATEPISVSDIAARAAMSPATLHRRFRTGLGCTPIQWLTTVRVEHARRLLEQSDLTIDQVAHRSGLGSPTNLRNHLAAQTGLTPTAYRRAFAPAFAGT
jgi:AraC family transcriptional activator FtrA